LEVREILVAARLFYASGNRIKGRNINKATTIIVHKIVNSDVRLVIRQPQANRNRPTVMLGPMFHVSEPDAAALGCPTDYKD
jgi:hypothetical protein